MSTSSPLEMIFFAALEKGSPAERAAFLDEACANDSDLRARVERMLAAQVDAGSFLEVPVQPMNPTIDLPITEKAGDAIGPYKLLQQIGEGGMGVVYMAEQTAPVERRVALKIIKPGMDTRQVIARFEAERQALAMMDHPHIAKVLDAGTTKTGRPYFVMELVKGTPITNYCDEHHLTPHQRLELFIPVCLAIQHAHQKGIIHRDIKPSNVLVAHYDDQPVPKVIDFGVAKAIDHRLTEKTMFTEYGQVVGTLEYMSPEQARFNQWDVDTRSDVYSLGVLLYELLAGETPFDRERLRSAAFEEVLRIIREEEPPRPSMRLNNSESLPAIAINRKTEPAKLSALIHGELDWIVMKAVEKDRTRRYETASKFADDLQHFLAGETVEACPPSAVYRFRKFVRRNKTLLATISAVAAALVIGSALAIWQAVQATNERNRALSAEAAAAAQARRADQEADRANREADRARAEAAISNAVNEFLNKDLLAQANPFTLPERDVTLRQVVDLASEKVEGRFNDQPLVEAAIHQTLADTYMALGDYEKSAHHSRLAYEIRRRILGENSLSTLESNYSLGISHYRQRNYGESERLALEVIQRGESVHGRETKLNTDAYNLLALTFHSQGRVADAEEYYRKALEIGERVSGKKDHVILTNLGILTNDADVLRQALEVGKAELPEGHPELAATMFSLAGALGPDNEDSADLLRESREIRERVLGPKHPHTLDSRAYPEWVEGEKLRKAGEYKLAIERFSAAISLRPAHMHMFYANRGMAYAAIGEWNRAIEDYDSAIENHPPSIRWISDLRGRAYSALGDWMKAREDSSTRIVERKDDPIAWLQLAALNAYAEDEESYVRHCRNMLEHFRATSDLLALQVLCKACLLRPEHFDTAELPVAEFDRLLEAEAATDDLLPWCWADRALVAYRAGDAEAAVSYVAKSQSLNPLEIADAMNFAILAMASQTLKRHEEARRALQSATELITRLGSTPEYDGHFDLQIATILRGEAESLINGDKPLQSPGPGGAD